jgi:hypothetical protein
VSFVKNEQTYDTMIETFGVILCWTLAGYYFYKSWKKRQRRMMRQKEQQNQHDNNEKSCLVPSSPTTKTYNGTRPNDNVGNIDIESSQTMTTNYGSSTGDHRNTNTNDVSMVDSRTTTTVAASTTSQTDHDDHHYDHDNDDHPSSFQPWTIITLTVSGALDEISYFPSLLLGHIFTGTELIVGTVITVLIMLCIVTQLLQYCQPLLHCLDQIPLYGIITLYAILLTVNLVIDLTSSSF